MIQTCCIIGAGNVAWHLAQALSKEIGVKQVYSRDINNARKLGDLIGAEGIDTIGALRKDADLYLISVPDDHIEEITAASQGIDSGIWAHTSGSMPMDVFRGKKSRHGVFYPLQTFSKSKAVEVAEVPMLIEGSDEDTTVSLLNLAERISRNCRKAVSTERRQLHVAAVFACNFVNYMWIQADDLLRKSGLSFDLLKPLLAETLDKLNDISPAEGQTGPARRGDFYTIEKHLSMLSADQAEIYKLLSDKIYALYNR